MVITLDWTILQFALILATFLLGITLGWKYMAIWALGVYFATLAADGIGPRIERLVNKFLSVGASFVPIITGGPDNSVTAPSVDIASPDLPLWQAGFLVLLAVPLTIFVSRWLGNMGGVGLLGRFWGGVFGALGIVVLLGKVTDYWRTWASAPGHSDPFANFNLNIPLPEIVLGGSSTAFNWGQLGGLAVVLIVALFVGYAFWRALRLLF